MVLGALVDAGLPLSVIQDAVSRLGLDGVEISAEPASAGAVQGTRVRVEAPGDQHPRDWHVIRQLIEGSSLEPAVRDAALAVFSTLASAEAEAHGVVEEAVHFHEVGAVDSIVDIVGACAGLRALGIERIVSGPVATGSGWVNKIGRAH